MSAAPQAQTTIYETTIDDPDLEKLLEQRQTLKDAKSEAVRRLKETDDVAKLKLRELDLGEGAPVRIGRFVVSESKVAARSVSFETDPTSRLQIRLLPEDA